MTDSALAWLTAAETRTLLDSKELSAVELTEATLERIATLEPSIHAHIEVTADVARKQAKRADDLIAADNAKPMTGIPVSLKDVLVTTDAPTTAGSQILGTVHVAL